MQGLYTPASITDWTTQPPHVRTRIGRPSGLGTQAITFAAGGATILLSDVGSNSNDDWQNASYMNGAGVGMLMGAREWTAEALFDSLVGFDASAFAGELQMWWGSPGLEKNVNSCRFGVTFSQTSSARTCTKFCSGANQSGANYYTTSGIDAPTASVKLKLSMREGKQVRCYYSLDGGAYVEVDATWRAANTAQEVALPLGTLYVGIGHNNGVAGGVSARLSSLVFSGVAW
jgi:hypothetical protein